MLYEHVKVRFPFGILEYPTQMNSLFCHDGRESSPQHRLPEQHGTYHQPLRSIKVKAATSSIGQTQE